MRGGAPPQEDEQSQDHEPFVVELDDKKDTPEIKCLQQQIHPIPPDKPTQPATTRPNAPILCRVDRVNSALPQRMTMSVETFRMAKGYSKSDPLIKNIKNLSTSTVHVRRQCYDIDKLDTGATPSICRVNSNKDPLREPNSTTGAEWHMDIVFGPCTVIGGITHGLYFVARTSRAQHIYPLKNITSSLLRACQKFVCDTCTTNTTILTDFDPKLIQGEVEAYFLQTNIDILVAPPQRQDKNRLAERNWQTIVNMARNWLRASLLPSKFWWFEVKRATELQNILPINRDGKITTPHTINTGKKVDYRCLRIFANLRFWLTATPPNGNQRA